MSDIIEMYISNVKKELYHLVSADDYLSDLHANLEEYLQEFPDISYYSSGCYRLSALLCRSIIRK